MSNLRFLKIKIVFFQVKIVQFLRKKVKKKMVLTSTIWCVVVKILVFHVKIVQFVRKKVKFLVLRSTFWLRPTFVNLKVS